MTKFSGQVAPSTGYESGVGAIVLTSSVCLSDRTKYRLEFWYGGQVEGLLGQDNRSSS